MLNYVSGIGEQTRRIAIRRGQPSYSRFMKEFKAQDLLTDDVNDPFDYGGDEIGKRKTRSERKETRKGRKEERKEGRKTKQDLRKAIKREKDPEKKKALRKQLKQERGSLVAKVAASPARAAFLVLVKLNFLKLKDKLKKAQAKNPEGLYRFWSKFGGSKTTIKNVISGYDPNNVGSLGLGAIGALPAVAAALATATPVLIAVAKFLKESGIMAPKEKESEDMDIAIDQGKQDLLKDPDISKDFANEEVGQDEVKIVRQTGDPGGDSGGDSDQDPGDSEGGFLGLTKTQLMLGGGALLIGGFLLMKKK
jgi:hypothetical protein